MSTLAESLAAQIAALDAELASVKPLSVGSDGVSIQNQRWIELSNQRIKLQQLYDRATGARRMFVRGRVKGLAHGRV